MNGTASLRISVTFPHGCYSGAESGSAEDLPSPARVHAALVAAAAGGPWASVDQQILVASDEHRAALEWLEATEPVGLIPPETTLTVPQARRYRWRANPVAPTETDFESRSALSGPVEYVWPEAPRDIVKSLQTIAREVTHVGRADSVAVVKVSQSEAQLASMHRSVARRGSGRVLGVAAPGRTASLVAAHRVASCGGAHSVGSLGKQAADVLAPVNDAATRLRRFAPAVEASWPYDEVWSLRLVGMREPLAQDRRVAAAVAIHRATVSAIGEDVPPFVTGRDGAGPMRGAGHMSIQLTADARSTDQLVLFGIPRNVAEADRTVLRAALSSRLRFSVRKRWYTIEGPPQVRAALPFWPAPGPLMRTEVPLVLDAVGRPRDAPWSLNDAVLCSVAYALRGVIEEHGVVWERGWGFRRDLVRRLRDEYDVKAAAIRAPVSASRFVHRVHAGELVVAAYAVVNLGRLAPAAGGFLALGRARHLGGGLLVPEHA